MKMMIMSVVAGLSLTLSTAALACEGEGHTAAAPKSVTAKQLALLLKDKKAVPVDANGAETRSKNGVIPGATLLTSSSQYALTELPANKDANLVFYCASEKCGASHTAAERAMEAGYTNVATMPEGIKGWKKSGQKTAIPNS